MNLEVKNLLELFGRVVPRQKILKKETNAHESVDADRFELNRVELLADLQDSIVTQIISTGILS